MVSGDNHEYPINLKTALSSAFLANSSLSSKVGVSLTVIHKKCFTKKVSENATEDATPKTPASLIDPQLPVSPVKVFSGLATAIARLTFWRGDL